MRSCGRLDEFDELAGERQRAPRGKGLQLSADEGGASRMPGELHGHRDEATLQVEVIPGETEGLVAAEPEVGHEAHRDAARVAGGEGSVDNPLDLVLSQVLRPRAGTFGRGMRSMGERSRKRCRTASPRTTERRQ